MPSPTAGQGRSGQRGLATRSVGVARKIGDVQVAQGDLAARADELPRLTCHLRTPGQGRSGQRGVATRSVGVARKDRRRAGCPGRSARRADELPRLTCHSRTAGQGRSRQRRLATRSVGVARQDRRRAGCPGRSARRADELRASLAIERLAKADPGNAGWQRDLIVSYVKLSEVTGDKMYVLQALDIALAMQERGILAPRDHWMIEDLRRRAGQ